MTPLVSVVVPIFDVDNYLPACLDSLLAQTWTNLEILAIDDGSTDGSGEMCDRYAEAYSNVRVVHKDNGGLSDARNAGLARARGAYIMFLDGDDWIESDAVSSLVRASEEADAEVVVAGYHVDLHDRSGELTSTQRRVPQRHVVDQIDPQLPQISTGLVNFLGYAWNKLYRRSLLTAAQARFPIGVSLVEDVLFNAPLLARAVRVAFLDSAFVHYVQRPRETLGTRPQPEFAILMTKASEAISDLLTAWAVPPNQVADVVHNVEVARVQWALRCALVSSGSVRSRLRAGRALLGDPAVSQILQRESAQRHMRNPRRWLLATQAHGQAVPTLVSMRVRGVLP